MSDFVGDALSWPKKLVSFAGLVGLSLLLPTGTARAVAILAIAFVASYVSYRALWIQARRPVLRLLPVAPEEALAIKASFDYSCLVRVDSDDHSKTLSEVKLRILKFDVRPAEADRPLSASDPPTVAGVYVSAQEGRTELNPKEWLTFNVLDYHINQGTLLMPGASSFPRRERDRYYLSLQVTAKDSPATSGRFEIAFADASAHPYLVPQVN